MKLARALVAASLVLGGPAMATTVHVSGSGADGAGCGSAAAPCRTISRATAITAAGDEILVGSGNYHAGAGEKYPILLSGQVVRGDGTPVLFGGNAEVDLRITAGEVSGLGIDTARLVVAGDPVLRSNGFWHCEIVVESGAPRLESNSHSGFDAAVTSQGASAPEIVDSSFFTRVALLATDASRPRFAGNHADVVNAPPYGAAVESRMAASPVIVDNELTGSGGTGVLVDGGTPLVEGNRIYLLEYGIHVRNGLATIQDNDISSSDWNNVLIGREPPHALVGANAPAAILRDNRFGQCYGPHLRISEPASVVDIGTPASPGGNVFSYCVYVDICNEGMVPVIDSGNTHGHGIFDPGNTDCYSYEHATAGPVYRVDP